MEQRFTVLTLGVTDLAKSTAFFERLGWKRSVKSAEGVSFFQCGSVALGLFPTAALAKDAGVPLDPGGTGRFAIAHNTRTNADVDVVLAAAKATGADIVKPAEDAFWGGYSGHFRDLDGHLWEVAWNPMFPLGDHGGVRLPE